MNLPAIALAISTLGLGSASIYLYTELDAARGRADAEAALRLDQEARVKALEEMRMRLERQLLAAGNGAGLDTPPATTDAGTPPPRPAMANTGPGDAQNRQNWDGFARGMRNRMNTPEGRKAMLAAQKMGLRAQYKDLAKELNLSTDQANQLIDMLAKQQAAQFDSFRENRGDPAAMAAANADRERQNEIELMGLLGDKYQKYQGYQDTLGERSQVEQLGVQFSAANLPLADSQKKQLMTAMVEERKVSPQPQWSQDATPQENMDKMRAWQESYNKRVAERAASVLNTEQLAQYKEMQSAQPMNMVTMGFGGRGMQFGGARVRAIPGAGR